MYPEQETQTRANNVLPVGAVRIESGSNVSHASNTDRCQDVAQQVDKSSAIEALGGNEDLLRELGTMFCEDAPLVLQELRQAIAANDLPAARRSAHSLKGLAATFFARNTCELALRIENEAAQGNVDALQDGGLEQLQASIESLATELERRGLTTR